MNMMKKHFFAAVLAVWAVLPVAAAGVAATDAPEAQMSSATYRVDDMHCRKCSNRITTALRKLECIDSVATSLGRHSVTVNYDAKRIGKEQIREEMLRMGYTPVECFEGDRIDCAYFQLEDGAVSGETLAAVKAIDGVADVTLNVRRKAMAVSFVKTRQTPEKLLQAMSELGVMAKLPAPHVCSEKE